MKIKHLPSDPCVELDVKPLVEVGTLGVVVGGTDGLVMGASFVDGVGGFVEGVGVGVSVNPVISCGVEGLEESSAVAGLPVELDSSVDGDTVGLLASTLGLVLILVGVGIGVLILSSLEISS